MMRSACAAACCALLALAGAGAGATVVLVHDEAEFRAALEDPQATTLIVNGHIALSSPATWALVNRTVNIIVPGYAHKHRAISSSGKSHGPWWTTAVFKAALAVGVMLLAAYPYFHLRAKLKESVSFGEPRLASAAAVSQTRQGNGPTERTASGAFGGPQDVGGLSEDSASPAVSPLAATAFAQAPTPHRRTSTHNRSSLSFAPMLGHREAELVSQSSFWKTSTAKLSANISSSQRGMHHQEDAKGKDVHSKDVTGSEARSGGGFEDHEPLGGQPSGKHASLSFKNYPPGAIGAAAEQAPPKAAYGLADEGEGRQGEDKSGIGQSPFLQYEAQTRVSPAASSPVSQTSAARSTEPPTCIVSQLLRRRSMDDASAGGLELGDCIGAGSFGRVYKGRWRGGAVAVKVVPHSRRAGLRVDALRESLLSSSIQHPNVVTTYHVSTVRVNRPPPTVSEDVEYAGASPHNSLTGSEGSAQDEGVMETSLILEFCDGGGLDRALGDGTLTGDLASIILCLMDIAAGCDYLHSLGVLHSDLKCANVLMKTVAPSPYDHRGFICKLADFGLARVLENNCTHVSTSSYGTVAYMPAELLQDGRVTRATDIYSFAMIMMELYTGKTLYEGLRSQQVLYQVFNGHRPPIPEDMPADYRQLMEACWDKDPAKRPPFGEIVQMLRRMYRDYRCGWPQRSAAQQPEVASLQRTRSSIDQGVIRPSDPAALLSQRLQRARSGSGIGGSRLAEPRGRMDILGGLTPAASQAAPPKHMDILGSLLPASSSGAPVTRRDVLAGINPSLLTRAQPAVKG